MEDNDTDSSDALNEYAASLEARIASLESRINNFKISGYGIAGDVDQGFTYTEPDQTDDIA